MGYEDYLAEKLWLLDNERHLREQRWWLARWRR